MVLGVPGSRNFHDSKILTCYNVSIITCLAILSLVKLIMFVTNPDHSYHSFFRSVRSSEYITIAITNIIIRLVCLLQKNKVKLFYKSLRKIDENFQHTNRLYSEVFWRLIFVLLVVFILLVLYIVGRSQLHLRVNNLGLFSVTVSCILIITSGCTIQIIIIDFVCSVCILNQRFRALSVITGNSENLSELTLSTNLSEDTAENARITLKRKLQILTELHSSLGDCAVLLTSAFSVQLMFIMAFSFVTVTYNSYFCILSFLDQSKGGFEGAGWNLIAFYWIILNMVNITVLISACDSASREVR